MEHLPADILILICNELSLLDWISIKTTCKTLYPIAYRTWQANIIKDVDTVIANKNIHISEEDISTDVGQEIRQKNILRAKKIDKLFGVLVAQSDIEGIDFLQRRTDRQIYWSTMLKSSVTKNAFFQTFQVYERSGSRRIWDMRILHLDVASAGDLRSLRYLHEKGYEFPYRHLGTFVKDSERDTIAVLEFLLATIPENKVFDSDVLEFSLLSDRYDVFYHLLDRYPNQWNKFVQAACTRDKKDVLKVLYEKRPHSPQKITIFFDDISKDLFSAMSNYFGDPIRKKFTEGQEDECIGVNFIWMSDGN
jgi:hypothetical protein